MHAQVWLSTWATLTVQSLAFIVQSAAFSAEHLEARCEAFVGAMQQLLTDMSEEAFASHVRRPQAGLLLFCSGWHAPPFLPVGVRTGSDCQQCRKIYFVSMRTEQHGAIDWPPELVSSP